MGDPEQGYATAQFNLGVLYANGQGIQKDLVEAYRWYLLAGTQGDESARKSSRELPKNLTPAQRASGQQLARDFVPR